MRRLSLAAPFAALPAALLAALLAAPVVTLCAQAAPATSLDAGARVKLDAPPASGIYTVVRTTPDTIVVARDATAAPVAIARADVRQAHVSLGRRTTGAGFGRGLAIGALVGGLSGVVLGAASGGDEPGMLALSAGDKAMLAGILLGGAGGLIGGLVGATNPGERWVRVAAAPRVSVAPAAGGRVTLALSRTF